MKEVKLILEERNIEASFRVEIKRYLEELIEIKKDTIFNEIKGAFGSKIEFNSILINKQEYRENDIAEIKKEEEITFAINYTDKKGKVKGFLWIWSENATNRIWERITERNYFSIRISGLTEGDYSLTCYPLKSVKGLKIDHMFREVKKEERISQKIIKYKDKEIEISVSLRLIEKEVKSSELPRKRDHISFPIEIGHKTILIYLESRLSIQKQRWIDEILQEFIEERLLDEDFLNLFPDIELIYLGNPKNKPELDEAKILNFELIGETKEEIKKNLQNQIIKKIEQIEDEGLWRSIDARLQESETKKTKVEPPKPPQNKHTIRYEERGIIIYYPNSLEKAHFYKILNQLIQNGTLKELITSVPDLEEIELQ